MKALGGAVVALAAALLADCEHAQPFGAADLGPNVPFDSTLPRQLTFGQEGDVGPAWLPDGSGIIYSFLRLDRPDRDRCLGILPADGGRLVRTICHVPVAADADSTDALWNPAVGPGGVLAYVRAGSAVGSLVPRSVELVVASLADPDPGRAALSLPFTAPDGRLVGDLTDPVWLDGRTLVVLADTVTYTGPPLPVDTIVSPVEILRIALDGTSATVGVVPGTLNATSVAADTGGAIYYTLAGDARVYRLAPGDSAAVVAFDFGSAGAPTGVQVRGGVLVAALAGRLVAATLGESAWSTITPAGLAAISAPALAPSRTRVVAQVSGPGGGAQLWLFEVP